MTTGRGGRLNDGKFMARSITFAAIGLLYGCLLTVLGLGAANGGDGTMLPLYIFSSPLCVPLLFFAPPVVWGAIAGVLANAGSHKNKIAFLVLMGAHYLGIVPYWLFWGDLDRFLKLTERSPASAALLINVYLLGNLAVWFSYLNRRPAKLA